MITGLEERLVFFPCGEGSLAGILTLPTHANGATVMIAWGAGPFPSSGPRRIITRLARELAQDGFHAFRFDYRGVGESDGEFRKADLDTPYTEEIVAAAEWLRTQELSRIIIVGNCFGGWSALMAAPTVPGLDAMVVLGAPVGRDHKQVRAAAASWRWWLTNARRLSTKKLRSRASRVKYRKMVAAKTSALVGVRSRDSRFHYAVSYLVDRRIPLLLIYGDDDFLAGLEAELDRGLRATLERAGSPTRLVTVPERLAGVPSVSAQDLLLKEIKAWLHELPELAG